MILPAHLVSLTILWLIRELVLVMRIVVMGFRVGEDMMAPYILISWTLDSFIFFPTHILGPRSAASCIYVYEDGGPASS